MSVVCRESGTPFARAISRAFEIAREDKDEPVDLEVFCQPGHSAVVRAVVQRDDGLQGLAQLSYGGDGECALRFRVAPPECDHGYQEDPRGEIHDDTIVFTTEGEIVSIRRDWDSERQLLSRPRVLTSTPAIPGFDMGEDEVSFERDTLITVASDVGYLLKEKGISLDV